MMMIKVYFDDDDAFEIETIMSLYLSMETSQVAGNLECTMVPPYYDYFQHDYDYPLDLQTDIWISDSPVVADEWQIIILAPQSAHVERYNRKLLVCR